MKITGRTILITGGSAGIGLAFAVKFLELGNEVIVTGRRPTVLDEVKAKYPKLHVIQSDVASPAQIAALAAREGRFPWAGRADEQRRHHAAQEPQGPGGGPRRVDDGGEHKSRRQHVTDCSSFGV